METKKILLRVRNGKIWKMKNLSTYLRIHFKHEHDTYAGIWRFEFSHNFPIYVHIISQIIIERTFFFPQKNEMFP